MRRFLPIIALAALVTVACDNAPTEPLTPETAAVAMFDVSVTGDPLGVPNPVTPSTNEINEAKTPPKWAHVTYVDVVVGHVTLDFVSERTFWSCFEYRIDDESPTYGDGTVDNFNTDISDGLWDYTCQNNSSEQMTFTAEEHVDIRMVFGAETDERFDWTRFHVLSLENKDECKDGDWEAAGFKNQGQCVRYVETGKLNLAGD